MRYRSVLMQLAVLFLAIAALSLVLAVAAMLTAPEAHGAVIQQATPRHDVDRPLRRLTPSARLTTRYGVFCAGGYATRARSVSQTRRDSVYRRYGMAPHSPGYVIDHLVPLELGGSNAITNLFPMRAGPAAQKDSVERWAHARACRVRTYRETVRLQHGFARNWRELYTIMRADTSALHLTGVIHQDQP